MSPRVKVRPAPARRRSNLWAPGFVWTTLKNPVWTCKPLKGLQRRGVGNHLSVAIVAPSSHGPTLAPSRLHRAQAAQVSVHLLQVHMPTLVLGLAWA